MKRPKTTLLLFSFFVASLFCVCQGPNQLQESSLAPTPEAVLKYLETAAYKNWTIWTGQDSLKRLGLPVHGRWVRTYINDIAEAYINEVLDSTKQHPKLKLPFHFPPGSFIVKENYRSSFTAKTITQADSKLAILTILYKPEASEQPYCATASLAPFNGEDCYGGDWFYGFYKVNEAGKPIINKLSKNVQKKVGSFCINCHAPAYKTDYVRTLASLKFPPAQPTKVPYCDQLIEAEALAASEEAIPADVQAYVARLDVFCNDPSLSNVIPADVAVDPAIIMRYYGSEKTQEMFDCFAWRTFVALNFPNVNYTKQNPKRGQAVSVDSFSLAKDNQRVWETFKTAYEVFQPEDVSWNPVNQKWNEARPFPVGDNCTCEEDELVITMVSKARDVPNETGQAFAGTFGFLKDRNSETVRYEVLFNETEFDYIIAEDRAATKNITPGGPSKNGTLLPVNFPDNRADTKRGEGVIEIKSAWKKLAIGETGKDCKFCDASTLEEAKKKFYVRSLLVYDEDPKGKKDCYRENMALIGLHVIHKTHYAPQWIWMTYEHKDNVPENDTTTANYTFFDPNKPKNPHCFKLPFLDTMQAVNYCPNVDINRFIFPDSSNQLTRVVPIDKVAINMNQKFQALLQAQDSPLANYILVDAQWPINGRTAKGEVAQQNCSNNERSADCYTMQPRYLRNSVIESFMTTYCSAGEKNEQFSNRSCMGCHAQVGTDFSYIWLDGVSQRVPIKHIK